MAPSGRSSPAVACRALATAAASKTTIQYHLPFPEPIAASPAAGSPVAESTPLLEIVIVAYRGTDLLRSCLASVRAHPVRTGEMHVHVVDNASGDDTPGMVASEFPDIVLHRLPDNVGFSAGNNVALRATRAPYVLLLNPDTELEEGTLDHMLAGIEAHPEVGMTGCRLYRSDGTFDHAAKRSFPTPLSALAHFTGIGRRAAARGALAQYRSPEIGEYGVGEVGAVNGAFMLVRREALEDVGLLDEGYWLYAEDLDWCARFWQHGWTVRYDGRVAALHAKGGSAGKHRAPKQNIAFHRGMGRFYRRFDAGTNPLMDVLVYGAILGKLALSLASIWLITQRAVRGH
jgi:N-acetylglucosaminyl-diphospho-decaprenol L-rhamnosyltransferase